MNNAQSISKLVDDLETSIKVNDAFSHLLDRVVSTFSQCSLVRTRGMLDESAILDAVNEIDLCIAASGGDRRAISLCTYALELAGISDKEIRIQSDGTVSRRMIYFVRNGRGMIKIGSSMNVSDRIRSLETGASETLELIASIPGTYSVERQLHDRFSGIREYGEWFRPSPELLKFIEQVAPTSS